MNDQFNRPADRIYLDHAATTPLDPAVFEAMRPFLWERFGNASSLHGIGRRARRALDDSRQMIAGVLGTDPDEIVFTGTGTESNNMAVIGAARARGEAGRHVIVGAAEHHSVLYAARSLRDEGFDVVELPVDRHGLIEPEILRAAMRKDTVLVSIGYANNEIGTVQQLSPLASIVHEFGAWFHTDAIQAAGQLDLGVDRLGVDLLSLAAHKFYGPLGAAALFVRKGVALARIAYGGAQEVDRRPGTENVPAIAGMGVALVRAEDAREPRTSHYSELRDLLMQTVLARIPDALVTGHLTQRLPSLASFAFRDIEGESLLINLDLDGIAVSTGAACAAGSVEVSHVIRAIGLDERYESGALRCSVGLANTRAQIERVAVSIERQVARLMYLASVRHGQEPSTAA